ncbi:MAG: GNAT family N-acetyltransferase [Candidatus Marinimicrobia bacterium]|nr:GNAT family N-acetyltransferase [Candidatus Neomarinimicrobiota bacterium]MBL7023724.1 GNAT family N-acetyltransferase [Candidatus Neomarinimicrobiota bacterium]MBL7109505.1 GNAT family N-acetyltransferase [Candidatus Neomarinimicrobiota bacterium]
MEQLTLGIIEKSKVKVIASSAFNFRIELVEHIGKDDVPQLIDVSEELAKKFGKHARLTKMNIKKYFNENTLPFVARLKGQIIGYIIGVPLEHFKNESWSHFDVNMGKNNTLYTYAFVVSEKYRHKGGYAKTLKRIYINWAKKRGYEFVTGHVQQGIAAKFSQDTQIVKVFSEWYSAKTAFEYYRRPLQRSHRR